MRHAGSLSGRLAGVSRSSARPRLRWAYSFWRAPTLAMRDSMLTLGACTGRARSSTAFTTRSCLGRLTLRRSACCTHLNNVKRRFEYIDLAALRVLDVTS